MNCATNCSCIETVTVTPLGDISWNTTNVTCIVRNSDGDMLVKSADRSIHLHGNGRYPHGYSMYTVRL